MAQEKDNKEKKQKQPNAPVCVGCLRWERFGEECYVYWEGKKFCTMKIKNVEEWHGTEQ